MGDIIDQLGNLLPYYHSIGHDKRCVSSYPYTEQHPLRWFLTRQINSFLWYSGEIIGDWYPLIRTKAVTKNKRSLKLLYASCIFYNLSKLAVPISQLFVSPTKLYNNKGEYNDIYVNRYYNYYWFLQAIISFSTFVYEFIIYQTLNKELFSKRTSRDYGILKKFRTMSEYRIIISAMVAIIAFPFLFIVSGLKIYFFFTDKGEINCSVEEFRGVVTNVQYMIIFIDQILLLNTKYIGKSSVKPSSYSEKELSSIDYNTGILHSQDTNVKKIVFKDVDNSRSTDKTENSNNESFNIGVPTAYSNNRSNDFYSSSYPLRSNSYKNKMNNYPLPRYNR